MKPKTAIAIVGNFKYLLKYFNTFYLQIRDIGKFEEEIIILTTYLTPTFLIKKIRKKNKVTVLRFPKIKFKKDSENVLNNLQTGKEPNRNIYKKFQWHKLHLFDQSLNRWNYILYLDINLTIHYELSPILNYSPDSSLLARSDSYPTYDRTLECQFDMKNIRADLLKKKYDLSLNNYFQTGLLYFDTKIIEKNTKKNLIDLVNKFPISLTNEQGIMNLYFIFEKNQIKAIWLIIKNVI